MDYTDNSRELSASKPSSIKESTCVASSSVSSSHHVAPLNPCQRAPRFVLPQKEAQTAACEQKASETEAIAEDRLRQAFVKRDRHRDIPHILAEWPCRTLKISKILTQDGCHRVFKDPDQIWKYILHGFLIRKTCSKLRCLDLTEFVPSKAMLYTMLQLIPLLSYRGKLEKPVLYDTIIKYHGIEDQGLLENLASFLDTILGHPVFCKGQKLFIPGPLEIIIDDLPLNADSLALYNWMMSSSLYDVTNVVITVNSLVFKYCDPSSEYSYFDPLLPLLLFASSACVQDIQCLAIECVPTKYIERLFRIILPHLTTRAFRLQRISLSNNHLDITTDPIRHSLVQFINKCPGISELDISKSYLSNNLDCILSKTILPLSSLNLSHCCLEIPDLEAIFDSKHSSSLKDLNLAGIYSSKCDDCTGHDSGVFEEDINHNMSSWVITGDKNSETDDEVFCPRDSSLIDSRKDQTGFSQLKSSYNKEHITDRILMKTVFLNLRKLTNINVIDLSFHRFSHCRVDGECFNILLDSLSALQYLRRINIQGLPLWNEDMFRIVRTLSGLSTMQNLKMSRSLEAPGMQMLDKFVFWQKITQVKNGKTLQISIDNFSDSGDKS